MRYSPVLCPVLILLFFSFSPAHAQDKNESYGIFENQQQYFEFMGSVKQEGANNPELMAMVPMINDIVLMQPFGSTSKQYGTSDSILGLLSKQSIRDELEMLDSQYTEIQKANREIQQRLADRIQALDISDMKSAVQQILAFREEAEIELQTTLLPHQMKRLRLLAMRLQLRDRSLVEMITSEPLKTELDVSAKQTQVLRKAEREIEEELQQQIAELRAKAHKRLLSNLNRVQRDRLQEIFGDDFVTKPRKSASKK